MRHLRMVGIGLVVALAMGAIGAGSALAKDPYSINTWGQYKYCPYENPEVYECVFGRTNGGATGGFFQYGKVIVKLRKPVVIQAGVKFVGEAELQQLIPAEGGETLESPELPITKGLNVITPQIQQRAEWPQALKESFNAAKKAKETKAFAKIEMAGTECFEVPSCLSTQNLVNQEGDAFRLPLKVKVTSPWLTKLGGGACYVGSDENPIMQHLTSGDGAGRVGEIDFNNEFTQVSVTDSQLVDLHWHIKKASGANGCGGEYEVYVNRALNLALEAIQYYEEKGEKIESENGFITGITVLTGSLHSGNGNSVRAEHENGNPELP